MNGKMNSNDNSNGITAVVGPDGFLYFLKTGETASEVAKQVRDR